MSEKPELNQAVTEALSEMLTVEGNHVVFKDMPSPLTHGYFNRRMFLEAFIRKAGFGVAIEPEDIMEYGGITEREFPVILKEYIDKGIVVKVDNDFGVEMYKLNFNQ